MGYYEEEEQSRREAAMEKAKMIKRLVFKAGIPLFFLFVTLCTLPFAIGINDAGQRTVVQWPNGTLFVKFTPGLYFEWFGSSIEYNDVITYDFDQDSNPSGATLDYNGIPVRYRDGGMGTIFGKSRFNLPSDEPTMLMLHKETRSSQGVASKILKSVTDEAINQTAGLMTSEEGYDSKRSIFTQMARSQLSNGLYHTRVETKVVTDEVTGKTVRKEFPVQKFGEDGKELHYQSDLKKYGITVSGFQLNNPGFEATTMKQISEKRAATMAIITAKATAEKAKQDAITAEEQGKADVMKAQYAAKILKETATVEAEKLKEVATIKASQKVEVAKQSKLEAAEMKLRAKEIKQEQIFLGEGEAERKRLVMAADGALAQKLDALVRINAKYADALGKHRLVPDIQFAGGEGTESNGATDLINMLMVKTAKDLSLDATIKTAPVQ